MADPTARAVRFDRYGGRAVLYVDWAARCRWRCPSRGRSVSRWPGQHRQWNGSLDSRQSYPET
jgi:hypothetical protein